MFPDPNVIGQLSVLEVMTAVGLAQININLKIMRGEEAINLEKAGPRWTFCPPKINVSINRGRFCRKLKCIKHYRIMGKVRFRSKRGLIGPHKQQICHP